MDHRRSYVFRAKSLRSTNRRRVAFEDGLNKSLGLRKRECENQWGRVQEGIDKALRDVSSITVESLTRFIQSQQLQVNHDRVSVGLVSTSFGSVSTETLFRALRNEEIERHAGFICLENGECPNLKALLKALIRKVTSTRTIHNDNSFTNHEVDKTAKLLNYDLRLLQRWCMGTGTYHMIVAFPQGEALSDVLLTSMISHLHSWRDRIKFTVLLGIGSSFDLFSNRLPKSIQQIISVKRFSTQPSSIVLDRVFETVVTSSSPSLYLGHSLTHMLLARHQQQIAGIESFTQSIKYAYISHFLGNPLSVFQATHLKVEEPAKAHFEAFRCLPSFKKIVETLLREPRPDLVMKLLRSDRELFYFIRQRMSLTHNTIRWLLSALHVFIAIQEEIDMPRSTFIELYAQALSPNFHKSAMLRELIIRIKSFPIETTQRILQIIRDAVISLPPSEIKISPDTFDDLLEHLTETKGELASLATQGPSGESDNVGIEFSSQRINLRKQNARSSLFEVEQTKLLQACFESIEDYLDQTFVSVGELFGNEILLYDLKAPHRDAFTPKVRFGIERAFSTPQDYLVYSCYAVSKDEPLSTHPSTAILYRLCSESSALINTYDLWSAFQGILSKTHDDEQLIKALFFKGLAELKAVGFIKPCRKRIDHIGKLAWKGV